MLSIHFIIIFMAKVVSKCQVPYVFTFVFVFKVSGSTYELKSELLIAKTWVSSCIPTAKSFSN